VAPNNKACFFTQLKVAALEKSSANRDFGAQTLKALLDKRA